MPSDFRQKVTRTDVESVANLAEDICAEPSCGMSIWVDKDLKAQGRKSKCMPCLVLAKFPQRTKD
jgi:hypothetical protein